MESFSTLSIVTDLLCSASSAGKSMVIYSFPVLKPCGELVTMVVGVVFCLGFVFPPCTSEVMGRGRGSAVCFPSQTL